MPILEHLSLKKSLIFLHEKFNVLVALKATALSVKICVNLWYTINRKPKVRRSQKWQKIFMQ